MTIIGREWPYAYVVAENRLKDFCSFCLKFSPQGKELRLCTGCKVAKFCNKDCQKEGWTEHRIECKSLKRVHPNVPDTPVRLLARVIVKFQKSGEPLRNDELGKPRITAPFHRQLSDLMSHAEEIADNWPKVMMYREAVTRFLGPSIVDSIPMADFVDIYGKVITNFLKIYRFEGSTVGQGLYLNMSALDHSCKPTAAWIHKGPEIVISSHVPGLTLGSATIAYTNPLVPSEERKAYLRQNFYFECACENCEDSTLDGRMEAFLCQKNSCGGPVVAAGKDSHVLQCSNCNSQYEKASYQKSRELMNFARKALESAHTAPREEQFEALSRVAKQAQLTLHEHNFVMVALYDRLFSLGDAIGKFSEAILWGEKFLKSREYYDLPDPFDAMVCIQIGQNLLLEKKKVKGLKMIDRAMKLAKERFPEGHEIYDVFAQTFRGYQTFEQLGI